MSSQQAVSLLPKLQNSRNLLLLVSKGTTRDAKNMGVIPHFAQMALGKPFLFEKASS